LLQRDDESVADLLTSFVRSGQDWGSKSYRLWRGGHRAFVDELLDGDGGDGDGSYPCLVQWTTSDCVRLAEGVRRAV
jgi:hypothetical protein